MRGTVKEMDEYGKTERAALELLPYRLSCAAAKCISLYRGRFNELRMRVGQPLCITVSGRNTVTDAVCTEEDLEFTVRRLSGNSLYSHANTLIEGYITSPEGIRAGICGRAVTDGEHITAVTDISSVCIRVPRRAPGAADEAYALLKRRGFSDGMLVYSAPGIGKTTLLRELCVKLASGEDPKRAAVVDTRGELAAGIDEYVSADIMSAYPRGRGIEIAVRTLSPEFIICDEIGSPDDAEAIRHASASGVRIIASAHAEDIDSLLRSDWIRELASTGVFGIYLGLLSREGSGYRTSVTYSEAPPNGFRESEVRI